MLFGHSGSTSGHPVIAEVARAVADALPRAFIIYGFLFDRRLKHGPTVAEFWGAPQAHEEESMIATRAERRVKKAA